MNATSATPLPKVRAGLVWSDGRPEATIVLVPLAANRIMSAVKPPVYGPMMGGTCWHCAVVVVSVSPRPPSAT
jgi:hypothetical protein